MSETDEPGTATMTTTETSVDPQAASVAATETSRRRSGRRWLIIGGIVVIFMLIVGYVLGGAAAASGPIARADTALDTAISHNNDTVDSFKSDPFDGVDFTSNTVDVATVRAAVATDKQKVAKWQAQVSSDRATLERVRPDLKSSILTLPEQGTLDRRRHRVEAALSALNSAQEGIDLYAKEIAFIDPFLDAMSGFEAIGKAGTANDLAGVKAQLPATGANMQKAVDLAQPPAVPAEFGAALKAIQKVLSDLQALVAAVDANDAAAAQKAEAALEADAAIVDKYDWKSVDTAAKALFQPLIDAYNREMKIAAGN